ncbi:MAG: IS21 family transposase, partial [Candidatus Eisenbacteria bacterium]|nr:IS21 family transposase [Candidatus Eisenbacteria bacterium]
MALVRRGRRFSVAALGAGMDEKTARKYRKLGRLPSEQERLRTYRTREDPFGGIWDEVREKLEVCPGLEAKTLFDDLVRRYPGRFGE